MRSLLMPQLVNALPGQEAQLKMAAYHSRLNLKPAKDAIQAAVLVLLYADQMSEIHLVFIERVRYAGDQHSGQIAFPGGKMEAADFNLENCALREAEEEIGLGPSAVEILGRLSPLYIPVSNFQVTPILAVAHEIPAFTAQVSEVATILPTPLAHFWDPSVLKAKDIEIRPGFQLKNVPFFDLKGHVLWGATAMILQELIDLVQNVLGDDNAATPKG